MLLVCVCPYVADAFFAHDSEFFFLRSFVTSASLQCLCLLVVRIHSGFIELTLTLNEFLLVNVFFGNSPPNATAVVRFINAYIYYSTLFAIVFFCASFSHFRSSSLPRTDPSAVLAVGFSSVRTAIKMRHLPTK